MSQPLLPPALLQSREFAGANLLTLLLYGAFSAALFLLPFDLIVRRGFSASKAGLVFLPIGLIIGLASRSAGRWADRVGPRLPLILGSVTVALAAILLALSPANLWLGAVGARSADGNRYGDGGGASHHRRDERGSGSRIRHGLGRKQRGQPYCRLELGFNRRVGRLSPLPPCLQSLSSMEPKSCALASYRTCLRQQGLRSKPRFFTPIRWRC